ncbi:MAG: hypothetical protein CL678_17915 [Bdellovibrionaceae bacterium]|nr:hypothetical protein [Pseudobdellovibrionaceae bacterium]|tara:strand:+ start:949 stop:1959 length:1011 start_codon:yes stop_codon:yes gene_type:complete
MNALKLSLFSLLLGIHAFANENLCEDTFIQSLLNSRQIQVLNQIEKNKDYSIKILTGTIDGTSKTIVLLGENHHKNQSEKSLGHSVIEQFDLYGYEEFDSSKTIGGNTLVYLLLVFEKIASKTGRTYSSTVSDIHETIKKSEKKQLPKKVNFSPKKEKISGMLAEMEDYAENYEASFKSSSPTDKTSIHLEKGHSPDFLEHFSSVAIPLYFISLASILSYTTYQATLNSINQDSGIPALTLVGSIGIGVSSAIIFQKLNLWIENKWKVQPLRLLTYPLFIGMEKNRNKTMAKNIMEALKKHPTTAVMINVIGKHHVSGVGKILQKENGFKEISLKN